MSTRLTKLLRAMALVGATVGLSACVAGPYGYGPGYGAPAYRVGYGYGGGYYGGGYRPAAPFFAPAAFRPAPMPFAAPRPPGGFFGPRPMAPVAHGGFFGGGFAPRPPMPAGGFFGRPHHHH